METEQAPTCPVCSTKLYRPLIVKQWRGIYKQIPDPNNWFCSKCKLWNPHEWCNNQKHGG